MGRHNQPGPSRISPTQPAPPLLRQILAGVSNAIVMLDACGAVVACSPEAERCFGGSGLPLLHSMPVLRPLLHSRHHGQATWTIASQPVQVRWWPAGSMLLLECISGGSEELRALQLVAEKLQAEIEELTCAYEVAIASSEQAQAIVKEQNEVIEQLLASNLDFQTLYEREMTLRKGRSA